MNSIAVVRIAKAIALIGFFLPWILVSCASQPIASFSGVSMAMGDYSFKFNGAVQHLPHASANLFLVLAILAIAGGLAYTFRAGAAAAMKETAKVLVGAAGAGAALSIVGVMAVMSSRDQVVSQAQSQNPMEGAAAGGAVQMSLQYGFWITLIALAVAGGAAWLIMTERESVLNTIGGEARRIAGAAGGVVGGGRNEDEAYWDRIPDKNDPNALEEYLHRFPDGKLAGLARARLERRGMTPPSAPSAPPPTPTPPEAAPATPPSSEPATTTVAALAEPATAACISCGAPLKPGARFCGTCGTAVASAGAAS